MRNDKVYNFIREILSDGQVHGLTEIKKIAYEKEGIRESVITSRMRTLTLNEEIEKVDRGQYKLSEACYSFEKQLDKKMDNILKEIDSIKMGISNINRLSIEEERKLLIIKEIKETLEKERQEHGETKM